MTAFINALWEEGSLQDIKDYLRKVNKEQGFILTSENLEAFLDSKPKRIDMIYLLERIWNKK